MARSGTEATGFPLPLDLPPMEARLVDELPEEPGWQFEPKWDGFRCLPSVPEKKSSCAPNRDNR